MADVGVAADGITFVRVLSEPSTVVASAVTPGAAIKLANAARSSEESNI